ncbi:Amino acid--[acyl-carrier-protein] ligase 1 [Listeria monocytogenes]|uniref:aminoacyl--tRNA ligase-related protein n=1 Tax=Listeria monocytogenes TaxID=1639 RepID=UPI000E73AA8A|nr:aminoacyl--tRNA ligase-related protein [Listeria monocytogenes]RKA27960.1 Amino acid--[acyl-carrier-protein] ligase 1 [Listeria monocytogenes]
MKKKYPINSNTIKAEISKIDETLLKLFSFLNFQEMSFPNLISESILEKIDYINSFGKYLFNVSQEQDSNGQKNYLTPAACLHIYPFIANNRVLMNESMFFTTRNRCFRNEVDCNEFIRKKEFEMREFIIFSESNKDIVKLRHEMMMKFAAYLDELQIEYSIELATDHFSDPDNKLKLFQEIGKTKYEFVVSYENISYSIASFNLHGDHFTNNFSIKTSDEVELNSGCVAFGLDRLAYTLLLNQSKQEES